MWKFLCLTCIYAVLFVHSGIPLPMLALFIMLYLNIKKAYTSVVIFLGRGETESTWYIGHYLSIILPPDGG
jgi:hypothetical protein